ncbi:MAG TPA: class I SAM-dependent methyltransferase [Dehalococcoidia bacterium]
MPENEPVQPARVGALDASTAEARKQIHEENRLSWNEATRAHNSHKIDQAKFFREGGQKLFPEEIELLGDLAGKSVLHLQCNAGQDTLSLKQLGAEKVTGVDISDEAIGFARKLSADSGIEATFHRADVYDWLAAAAKDAERWDIVFCSYGAICWLSDLGEWAKGFTPLLKPGGRFVTVEFHPVMAMFDPQMRHYFPYSTRGRAATWDEGVSDYVAESGSIITPSGWDEGVQDFENPHAVHEFAWGLSEVITALLEAGLVLEHCREYDYSNGYRPYEDMREIEGRRWTVPEGVPSLPIMYSMTARKPQG